MTTNNYMYTIRFLVVTNCRDVTDICTTLLRSLTEKIIKRIGFNRYLEYFAWKFFKKKSMLHNNFVNCRVIYKEVSGCASEIALSDQPINGTKCGLICVPLILSRCNDLNFCLVFCVAIIRSLVYGVNVDFTFSKYHQDWEN